MKVELSRNLDLRSGRVAETDAARQMATAAEILRRFERQPGVILADEVGMGKTFVALAVAVSVVEATGGAQPVVIKVPNGVREKWPRDWKFFAERCHAAGAPIRATDESHNDATSFLKLLDDPVGERKQILFLTHNALVGSLTDPWVKLAILSHTLARKRSLADQRRVFPRWARKLIRFRPFEDEGLVDELIHRPQGFWRSIYEEATGERLADDPVPQAIREAVGHVELEDLAEALRTIPLKSSAAIDERLTNARREIAQALGAVWKVSLERLDLRLPLLILDEAHHLKNPDTRLAGILSNPESGDDARGPLGGVFERMLFLTATPFQLGHNELIEILRRFEGVRWETPALRREHIDRVADLNLKLTEAQTSALRLDRLWGRLIPEDLPHESHASWWEAPPENLSDRLLQARTQAAETERKIRVAEAALRPWVIRHTRPDRDQRRSYQPGRSILDHVLERRGLEVAAEAVFPFLLAARAQAVVAAEVRRDRRARLALFADGLASSYEAFRETRRRRLQDLCDERGEDEVAITGDEATKELRWYLDHIEAALPESQRDLWGTHPKVAATARRAAELWKQGEKVAIFCFYRATGRALRRHISRVLDREILSRAAVALGIEPTDEQRIREDLERISARFFDRDTRIARAARVAVTETLSACGLSNAETRTFTEVVVRFLRTPSFLVRYVDLRSADPDEDFLRAYELGLGGQVALEDQVRAFAGFILQRTAIEREELARALDSIQTGSIYTRSAERDDPDEDDAGGPLLPNVRLVNGATKMELRHHLMLAFNSPFFPEILIASAVMSEGVDLHLNCRHLIHHDLDWNPSTLEQRTGRLDRMGCKSEVVKQPIFVYEPFIEATQDEKQFLVVKDRERWFNVVMGQKMVVDEWSTERMSARVPLPAAVSIRLSMTLCPSAL